MIRRISIKEMLERLYDRHANRCDRCCVLDLDFCVRGGRIYAVVERLERPQIW